MKKSILIRTEASAKTDVGTGHLRRSLWLGRALKAKGARVAFAVSGREALDALVRKEGFACRALNGNGRSLESWKASLAAAKPAAVVFDRWENDAREIRAAKEGGARIVLMDEAGEPIRLADVAINSLRKHALADYRGEKFVVTPPAGTPRRRVFPREARSLVCSFGGHDKYSLMRRTLRALAQDNPFDTVWCFCDPALKMSPDIVRLAQKLGNKVQLFFGDPRLPRYLAKADMGLISGGLTLFQALACGLPCAVISQYAHQAERATAFSRKGLVVDLGSPAKADWKDLARSLRAMRDNAAMRGQLSRAGQRFFDGKGLQRVTKIVWNLLQQ